MELAIAAVIAGMFAEGAVLLAYHRRTGRGISARSLLPILASGVMLLLAVLLAWTGAAWYWLSACMLGALVGHLFDLRARWTH